MMNFQSELNFYRSSLKLIFKIAPFLIFVFVFLFVLAVKPTFAAVKTWNPAGCASSDWGTSGNWSGGSPGTSDVATFDSATSNCPVTINASIDVGGINITNSYSGTITQANGADISFRTSGYIQASSASTFVGGDSTSDMTNVNGTGTFTLSSGTFTAPGGTISMNQNWTVSGGNFNANGGTLEFGNNSFTISTSTETYNNILFDGNGITYVIASGKTLRVGGTLFIYTINCGINGPGDIAVQGDITHNGNNGCGGTAVITVNGTGTQTWSGGSGSAVPGIKVDKASGTFVIHDHQAVGDGNWEYTRGNIDAVTYASEITINAFNQNTTLTGDTTFYDVTNNNNCATADIASGTTITVAHTLTMAGNCGSNINGPGTLAVQGNLVDSAGNNGGTAALTLSGGNDQTVTYTSTGAFLSGTVTINKTAGTVTLATDFPLDNTGQDLVLSAGVLNIGAYNLTVTDVFTLSGQLNQTTGSVTADAVIVGSKGVWVNNSDGDFTLGSGGLSNSGFVRFDGNGPMCGGMNSIAIGSSSPGTSRPWSGSGTFIMNDVTVQDQSSGDFGSNYETASSGSLTTTDFAVANGDLLIALVGFDDGAISTVTMSDSVGTNTWLPVITKQTDGRHNQSMQMFYAKNVNGSASMNVTASFSPSASAKSIIVVAVSNIDTSAPLDKTDHVENETGAPITVGPVTPVANGEFIFGGAQVDSGSNSISEDSPYSAIASIGDPGSGYTLQSQYYIQPTASSISSTWTLSGTNDALAQIATFKNNGSTPVIGGQVTAYSSTNTSNNGWTFVSSCPPYSNRTDVKVTGGTKITGGTKLRSN